MIFLLKWKKFSGNFNFCWARPIFLTDETNLEPSKKSKFFVYGGLIIPINKLDEIDQGIGTIREESGYKPEDELKFESGSKPTDGDFKTAQAAKEKMIDLCLGTGCKFIVYVIHHGIAKNKETRVLWAADATIAIYHQFLEQMDSSGICLVDNLPIKGQKKFLQNKFATGLTLQDGSTMNLDRIKLFGSTYINTSHISSAIDVILGSFRYCINNPRNIKAAESMMKKVFNIMWYERINDELQLRDKGLILRPSELKKYPSFIEDYIELLDNINDLLK